MLLFATELEIRPTLLIGAVLQKKKDGKTISLAAIRRLFSEEGRSSVNRIALQG